MPSKREEVVQSPGECLLFAVMCNLAIEIRMYTAIRMADEMDS